MTTATKTTKKKAAPRAGAKRIAKPKAANPKDNAQPKRVTALDAAAQVLAQAKTPMNCQELVAAMAEQGLWASPAGKTPHATLYSAILREIAAKGSEARFVKVERGKFAAKA